MAVVAACSATDSQQRRAATGGDEVIVHYTGRLEDGTVFESTEGRGPVTFTLGEAQVVPGFEAAIWGLTAGQKTSVTVKPENGYGERRDDMLLNFPKERAPAGLQEGMKVQLGSGGKRMEAVVYKINDDGSVVLDVNPPLAGKTLTFDVELVGFRETELGMEIIGWGGRPMTVPFAIASSPVSKALEDRNWPAAWPYSDFDFRRQDETEDVQFYSAPRLVTHIDDGAIGAIRKFYEVHFSQAPQDDYAVLDICSSWISHYPENLRAKRVAITGMVEEELAANKQATEYHVKDLNKDPGLPFGDGEFDFVTNVVSVDYLTRPREIFREMHRVMKPGGVAIMSFSNRCFPSKAISMWVADMGDGPGHCKIVGDYFRFGPEGGWENICSVDISPSPRSDPIWVVMAVKAGSLDSAK